MVVKVAAVLLLGAIINVAVALYIVSYGQHSTSLFAAEVMASLSRGPGHRSAQNPYQQWEDASFAFRRWSEPGGGCERELTVTVAVGWPMLSFHSWSAWDGQQKASSCDWHIDVPDLRKRTFGWVEKEFPLMPRIPGFAINTIFYASIVWALFAGPGAMRRRLRKKRGQCASCGYSLRGGASAKCPECGATA